MPKKQLPNGSSCFVPGCPNRHYARGKCLSHYQYGPADPDERVCSKEGCGRRVHTNDLCVIHLGVSRRQQVAGPGRRSCDREGCDKLHYAKGMCFNHYRNSLRKKDKDKVDVLAKEIEEMM